MADADSVDLLRQRVEALRAVERGSWIATHLQHGTVTKRERFDECSCGGTFWREAAGHPAGSFGYCAGCYHPLDRCSHCDTARVEALQQELDELIQQRDALSAQLAELQKYVRHTSACPLMEAWRYGDRKPACTCGLSAALQPVPHARNQKDLDTHVDSRTLSDLGATGGKD